jgi:hypothetical protein
VSPVLLATVGHGATSLWYMTRATGLVALVVLSVTVVIGIVCSIGWASERWPRFLSQSVHRNVSLLGVALVVVHVVTTVADGYVPISLADAIIPFRSPYRTLWIGLGACAFDLLLAVGISSGVRRRIGARAWRAIHWAAYACWPVALFHALGSGTDARLPGVQFVYLVCTVSVITALGWRIVAARSVGSAPRLVAAVSGTSILFAAAVFAFTGPMRPGWSHRAGTASAVLAELGTASSASLAPAKSAGAAAMPVLPTVPFSSGIAGTFAVFGPDGSGQERIVFSMHLGNGGVPLTVTLAGSASHGGVELTSGQVSLGTLHGPVTSLDGSAVGASVTGSGSSDNLSIQLLIDRAGGLVSGSVAGTAEAPSARGRT